jgi:hypothetical protein
VSQFPGHGRQADELLRLALEQASRSSAQTRTHDVALHLRKA